MSRDAEAGEREGLKRLGCRTEEARPGINDLGIITQCLPQGCLGSQLG